MIGPWKYVLYGVIALALVAAIIAGIVSYKKINQENDNALVNSGEVKEREKGQAEVINHVKEVQDARDNPTPDELNIVCSKYDRNCPTSNQ